MKPFDQRDFQSKKYPPATFWVMFILALGCLAMMFLSGCAKAEKRLPITFPPVNPDVAAVTTIVAQTKASTARASDSASRAVQIVERIVVAPGQEVELQRLKLELSTTVEQLKFATEFLDAANVQVGVLTSQVEDCKRWGIEQQTAYHKAYAEAQVERSRADAEGKKAFRNGRERDVFVLLFAIAGATVAVNFFCAFLWKLQPGIAALALAGIALSAFVGCFTVIRFIVSTVVRLTT